MVRLEMPAASSPNFADVRLIFSSQGGSGRIGELSIEQWRRIQAVNYDAVFYAMKVLAPVFEAQGSGSFIATTSISARIVNVPLDQVRSLHVQRQCAT